MGGAPEPALTAPPGLVTTIVAGGSGTRLWPRSRKVSPKHLVPLAPDGSSLLRHAYQRAARLGGEVLVVTAAAQAERVLRELPELPRERLLREPVGRGTAPALAWAALEAERLHRGAVMVSLHADHLMPEEEETARVLLSAARWAARRELLITIGVAPRHPATGYGYIRVGPELERPNGLGPALPLREALAFREKPSREQAERMLDEGGHLWNTGLFAWSAKLFLGELEAHAPEVLAAVRRAVAAADGPDFASLWAEVPDGVVDRLVLERSRRVAVLPAALSWSDLGSFRDLFLAALAAGRGDRSGNVATGEVLVLDSRDSHLDSSGGRLVAVLGVEGLAVVDTPDALLVCPLSRVQEVSKLVHELRERGRTELL